MTTSVLEKLKSVQGRYEELTRLVSDPAVQSDPPTYRTHSKALAELQPLVDRYREYLQAQDELAQAREVAASGDPDLQALARDEIASLEQRLTTLTDDLRQLLTPRDPNDDRNVVLEIRAGTGGDEAALFASDLFRMYSRYAERRGWKLDVLSMSETGVGGLKEATATIAACIACSACRLPRRAAAFTRPRPPSQCYLRPKRWTSRSTQRICASIRSAPAARAARA